MPANSLGLAVILLTVLIRILLLPLTKSITRQQALMTKLKPQMDEIREKYKEDQAKQAKALMSFYKKHHVNPVGSCLPTVIQLVVLIVLYYVFRLSAQGLKVDLLYSFIPHPAMINTHFLWLDLAKPDLWILPIVTGALQFYQGYQMLPKGKAAADDPSTKLTRQMTYIFPFTYIFVARSFPSALPLYWAVSSIISIIQQTLILRHTAKLTIDEADVILESDDPEETEKKIEEKTNKKGVAITVRKKQK